MVCIKLQKFASLLCCERNAVCESHVHSNGKTCNKRTSDLLYKNPHFFVITRPNQMEFSLKCRKIVMIVHYVKLYCDSVTNLKVIHAESPIVIFFWDISIHTSVTSSLYV